MPVKVPLIVPHESVNDESVRLVRWLVEDGGWVEAGQAVAEVEGSKATFPIVSESAGQIRHGAQVDSEIAVGKAFAFIHAPGAAPIEILEEGTKKADGLNDDGFIPAVPAAQAPIAEHRPNRGAIPVESLTAEEKQHSGTDGASTVRARFSRRAQERLREHGIDASTLANAGMVRESDVLKSVGGPTAGNEVGKIARNDTGRHAAGPEFTSSPLSRQKRTEGRYLRRGSSVALPSLVSVLVPTHGIREALRNDQEAPNLSALIIFEVARLLRRYPDLNAYYSEDSACRYSSVHVGFAVAGDYGLKVPVVRNADKKQLSEIGNEVREHLLAYVQDAVKPEHLAGGTFTISDLSAEGVFALTPLINQEQSAILGIGAEVGVGSSDSGFYTLSLAFDHQLTDGLTAARFLNDLSGRLQRHESTLAPDQTSPTCVRCFRTMEELGVLKARLLKSVGINRATEFICTLCVGGF
jgi:pyruvate/2-oxoglutarate dehydrogenase complex dihydrolipoamide acyltransferase (E2) component